jgi:DNA-binding beta-propeller fold protein YncE
MTGPDCPVPNPEPIPCDENGNMTGPDCPSPPCEYGNMTGPDCPSPPCEYGNMTGNGTGCVPNPVPPPPCEYGNMTGNATCPIPPSPPTCKTTGGNMTGGNMTKCRPHANAGTDRSFQEGQIITIDGSRSYDSDGTINNYRWTYRIGNGTDNLISNGPHSDKLRLRAPQVNKDQMYILTLTVTDNSGLSDKDSMKLLVKDTINTNSVTKKTTTKTVTTTQKGEILKYYYIGKIGFPGTGKGQVLEPTDVAIDTLHNIIYVADKNNHRIDVFDTNGKYIKSWGSLGSGKGQFNNPADLAADFAQGLIFVSDIGNNRVEKFDTNGKFLGMWGSSGTGIGQFDQTGDVSLDPTEKMVYVSDIGNNRIQKFDYDGNFVKSWGAFGTGSGQFNRPAGLTYDSSGIVFVADTKNNRIQKFDKQGTFVQSWGIQGKGLGQLQNPVSITAEPDSDYVYVTHGGDKRIEVFDKHGKHVISWGSAGVGNGQLKRAVSVAFGNDNKIFVTDKDKSEIDIFGIVYQTHPYSAKKTTTQSTTTNKSVKTDNPSPTNSLGLTFTGFCCSYNGKVTVTVKNTKSDAVLGKSSFQISENHDTAQMTFETKDSNTGDNLAAIAQDKGPVGGVSSNNFSFDLQKHKYHLIIDLDEFGCDNCG